MKKRFGLQMAHVPYRNTPQSITDIVAEKKRVVMQTTCSVRNQIVLEGEAIVMVPARS